MISEEEARALSSAISTAMRHNDKQAREALYDGLGEDDLKRILRWTIRQSIHRHNVFIEMIGRVQQMTPDQMQQLNQELWEQQAIAFAAGGGGAGSVE